MSDETAGIIGIFLALIGGYAVFGGDGSATSHFGGVLLLLAAVGFFYYSWKQHSS